MTKDVIIQIDGYQLGEEKEQISVKAAGTYRKINQSHYVHYKEASEHGDSMGNNTIKLNSNCVEMMKSGTTNTKMVFDQARPTKSSYNTPYGSFSFDIHTTSLLFEEQAEQIKAELKYFLSSDGHTIQENQVKIIISNSDKR